MTKAEKLEHKLSFAKDLYRVLFIASHDFTDPVCVFVSIKKISSNGMHKHITYRMAYYNRDDNIIHNFWLDNYISNITGARMDYTTQSVIIVGCNDDMILTGLDNAFTALLSIDDYKHNTRLKKWLENSFNFPYVIV